MLPLEFLADIHGDSVLMPPRALSIASAINNSYVLPLAVMLESLKQHLRPTFKPVLYLIHGGIPEPSLVAISSIVETHSIIPSDTQLSAAPRDPHFPREASFPLLLADLLPPAVERVLFLDADMLVLDDLANLWETPMDQRVLAAAPDSAVPLCSAPRGVKGWQAQGIPREAPYFNCGVLMIHLMRWRQREVTRRARHYLETTREQVDFLHQEALNAVLWDDWKPLDSRWNMLGSRAGRPYARTTPENLRQPGIIHFAGRMKPWRAPIGGPFNAPYRKVLERVLAVIPPQPPALRHRLYSVYDRHLRSTFFPVERFLWRQRLI
jgi:lipopolysaccharide biosynthesis glycosyltransferase